MPQSPLIIDDASADSSFLDDSTSIPRRSLSGRYSQHPPHRGRHSRSRISSTVAAFTLQLAKFQNDALAAFEALQTGQKAAIILGGILAGIMGVLFLVYRNEIFHWLIPYARDWRDVKAGWLLPFVLVVFISLPPMIGYSTVIMVTGFIYGVAKGWLIAAASTVVGSTISYFILRYPLLSLAKRLTAKSHFQVLSKVIEQDGLRLVTMARFCPFPYSLSNAFIATIPSVSWKTFAFATFLSTPKLLIHVLVGTQLGKIAEHGGEMDKRTKILSYLSVVVGLAVGLIAGRLIYSSAMKMAEDLQNEAFEEEQPLAADLDGSGLERSVGTGDYLEDSLPSSADRPLPRASGAGYRD